MLERDCARQGWTFAVITNLASGPLRDLTGSRRRRALAAHLLQQLGELLGQILQGLPRAQVSGLAGLLSAACQGRR